MKAQLDEGPAQLGTEVPARHAMSAGRTLPFGRAQLVQLEIYGEVHVRTSSQSVERGKECRCIRTWAASSASGGAAFR